MTVLVPIGDFSRMTHLSVKALRFYHDQGLLEQAGLTPAGPGGALFPAGYFELQEAELTAFVPVDGPVADGGRATVTTIPGVEAAVTLHCGSPIDSDQTYGALGTIVAERAIGI